MRNRPLLGMLFAVACMLSVLVPGTATAIPIHQHSTEKVHHSKIVGHDPTGPLVKRWTTTRTVTTVVNVAPADTDQDGIADASDDCPSTASTVNGGCPPPPPPEPAPAPAPTAPVTTPTTTTSTGSYSIPSYIVDCESGGSYSAVNSSSGAYGAYQIMPSTASAYGCDLSTASGQDQCAAEIYADVGSSAWSCG